MSPEQVHGQDADGRSDIFAFGCVLYEMLTGKRAFDGHNPASIIAAILERPAPSIMNLAPPALDRVLKRCLEKDPDARWQSARDLKGALELITEPPASASGNNAQRASASGSQKLFWTIVAVFFVVAVALSWIHFTATPPSAGAVRFQILPPANQSFTEVLAISPDGRKLAFNTLDVNNRATLWIRSLDSLDAKRLSSPLQRLGVSVPVWSPDSRFIAYYAEGKLNKVDSASGDSQILCDAPGFRGAAWSSKGIIAFGAAMGSTGLWTVPEVGGTPKAVTTGSAGLLFSPRFLPDGKHFLYRDLKVGREVAVYLGSLSLPSDRQSTQPLLSTPFQAEFAPFAPHGSRGYLLFVRDSALLAQSFDADAGTLSGEPTPVVNAVSNGETSSGPILGSAAFSVSENGVLAYRSGTGRTIHLTRFDRSGKLLSVRSNPAAFTEIQLSPNGKSLAGVLNGDIWILDLERDIPTRFTFDGAGNRAPVWSPDGTKIAYAASPAGAGITAGANGNPRGIWVKSISGGEPQMVYQSNEPAVPSDWTKDGQNLVLTSFGKETGADILRLPLTPDHRAVPLVQTKFQEGQASVSPNGKWLLYVSLESGTNQTYVRRFPSGEGKWVISDGQGVEARWSADGRKIYYRHAASIMEVDVKTGTDFSPGMPKLVTNASFVGAGGFDRNPAWTVSPDGSQFLGMVEQKSEAPDTINVVLNWQSALKK